ncbi:ornithine carbamoyltransferase [Helicobacter sp. CLO-3]|uniref:ornithine carbamoyltransferase n=1 Tax=unclassified Helicobacter TaxID=2593540 RepID=UPI000804B388|nr:MULTISPECIES: ornithine carbamoyltransferase [unclassified Helicobacter]OBV30125.1 ornithine carbamoyltransferase [Helicobacter sp. CLO-3]OHU83531.1 ornithine carbamoyltransferase [Helicobacter sp. CLO-3]
MQHFLTLKDFSKQEIYEILASALVQKAGARLTSENSKNQVAQNLDSASVRATQSAQTMQNTKAQDSKNTQNTPSRAAESKTHADSAPFTLALPLFGKNIALILEKPSTRTRVSFEAGVNNIGAHPIVLMGGDTQIGRGEPIKDTARVLSGMVDMVMIRTFEQARIEEFARYSQVPVINGLTDLFHPLQILADMLTMIECGIYPKDFGEFFADFVRECGANTTQSAQQNAPQSTAHILPAYIAEPIVAYIGDGNNITNSWLNLASILDIPLRIATPKGYEPDAATIEYAKSRLDSALTLTHSPESAIENASVVITDTWISMGQEEEKQRRVADFKGFCVDENLMQKADKNAIFLHCLPAYRGYEVSENVIESAQSKVWLEAHNRLYIQQGVMLWLARQNKRAK